MKSLVLAALLLLIPLSLHAQAVPPSGIPTQLEKEKCTVAGMVLRLDTGEPLKKAMVILSDRESQGKSVSDFTDGAGHFRFEDIEAGSYKLFVIRSGFVSADYGQRKPEDPGAVLTLHRGQEITDLIFKLVRTGVIVGHVFDEDGEPLTGAEVQGYRVYGRGKHREFGELDRPVLTNDAGEYRIFGLEPGRYYLAVNYQRWHVKFAEPPQPAKRLREGYLTAFYPNTTEPAKASPVTLGAGEEIPGVDFSLKLSPLVSVKGVVHDAPVGRAQANPEVVLIAHDSDLSSALRQRDIAVNSKGEFEIHDVAPGTYDLVAFSFDSESQAQRSTHRELEVGNADIEGLILSILPPIGVSGRIQWDSPSPASIGDVTIFLSSINKTIFAPTSGALKQDGTFVVKNVPEADYRPILQGLSDHCFLKSAKYGDSTLSNGSLSIHPRSDTSLELLVSCRAPHVSGTVLTSDSLPAPGVYVVLVPDPPQSDRDWKYSRGTTDQNGNFTLKGVEPGDYKLFSWSSAEDGDWLDDDWLKPFLTQGLSVHLEEGDHKTLQLQLIEAPKDPSTTR
jgi:hypothetical protein